ncbi:hypothetical protein [Spongiimicrobium salis]|uniref:hypothetical protein n=1 Tax=Spongiimicrobium salis TaxID=1667022 RepID=UPI00374D8AA6
MTENYIEFKKQRELGEIISDTFAFIRVQFKPFFKAFFTIVGPYLLAMLICLSFYLYIIGDQFNFIDAQYSDSVPNLFMVFLVALLYIISIVAVYTISQSTVLHYIKSYAASNGQVDMNEVRRNVYKSFWSFIGLGILVGLSVGVGLLFCLIPGIYLYVPLSLAFSILVFTNKDVMDSYSYSFTLVKDEWWMTFAALFVVGIIVTVASYAFALPASIYSLVSTGISSGEIDIESFSNPTADPIQILLQIVSTVAQFMLNLITIVAGCLIYFNLNEKKNFTGTYERIKNLGSTTDQ